MSKKLLLIVGVFFGILLCSFTFFSFFNDNISMKDLISFKQLGIVSAAGEFSNSSFLIVQTRKDWNFFKQVEETDYNDDDIPDVISTFTSLNETVIEITVDDTREHGGYQWSSVICNISGVDSIQKEEYNPATEVWTNTGELNYQDLQYTHPEGWCNETGSYGFVLFGAGSGDKTYRLIFPEGEKEFKIFAGDGSEETVVVYQNISQVQFIEGNLSVNNTLRKWNGNEFIIAPEDIWIDEPEGDNYKFGANDTIAVNDTLYQYKWVSNKLIYYDEKKDYYYFEEYKTGENDVSILYNRRDLNVDDVCNSYCINIIGEGENQTCEETFEPSCSFNLVDYYYEVFDEEMNSTYQVLNYSKLTMNFTGFYNLTTEMIFIDPAYTYTNVSLEATLNNNIRSEAPYSHLSAEINNSLVLYMPFDVENTSLTVYDYTNNDNDGTLAGPVFNTTDCKFGNCFTFDGVDDYVEVTQSASINNLPAMSISLWMKPTTIDLEEVLLDKRRTGGGAPDGWIFNKLSNFQGVMFLRVEHATTDLQVMSDNINTVAGEWGHFVLTWDGSATATNVHIYENGVEKGYNTQINGVDARTDDSSNSIWIGAEGDGTDFFNGNIDEVAIWNRSLSAFEVGQLYNATFQKFYQDGNQTFNLTEVSLGTHNRVNVTVKAQSLNDSALGARIYEANVTDGSNPSVSYINQEYGLVLYMHMDNWSSYGENDTLVYDFSGLGNNGTVIGGNITVPNGKFGRAMQFDGDDDRVDVGQPEVLGVATMSLSFWIKQSSAVSLFPSILVWSGTGDDYLNVFWGSNEKYNFRLWNDAQTDVTAGGNTIFADTNWHHIVGVYNGTNVQIYVDGNADDSTPPALTGNTESAPGTNLFIGASNFNGLIDEVLIFNRSLSADEIKSLYLTGSTNHTNNGPGLNWTESSSGVQELIEINSTYLQAKDFVIKTSTEYILPEIEFNSTYGFYSSILESVGLDTYTSAVPPEDSCTYDVGDWIVDCSDYCNITSNVDAGGNNIILSGTGSFNIQANITADLFAWVPTCQVLNTAGDGNSLRVAST